jgi:hypothetical protein
MMVTLWSLSSRFVTEAASAADVERRTAIRDAGIIRKEITASSKREAETRYFFFLAAGFLAAGFFAAGFFAALAILIVLPLNAQHELGRI